MNEIAQDASSVGNALKTISMRIRAMDEETGEFDDTLQTISGDIYELTHGQVSIMQDANTYKDIYTILDDISKVWDSLTDKEHATLTETLFGKHRANIGSAIISNFEQARKAIETMKNADGGAMAEMEVIMDSISYKTNTFKETLVGIAQSSFSQDFLKSMVDSGTRILNVFDDLSPAISFILEQFATLLEIVTKLADTIGGIPLLIAGIGLKNVGNIKTWLYELKEVQMAINGISALSTWANGGTNQFADTAVVTQYANQLRGLSAQQVELALSTKLLTAEQKQQIMVELGLVASENKIQSELLQTTLAQSGLSAEKQKAVLTELNLINATTGEVVANKACTKSELEKRLALEGVTVAQTEQIMSTLGMSTANATATVSFEVLTKSIKKSIVALGSFLFTTPAGWATIAVTAIVGVVAAISSYNKEQEELRQQAEESAKTLKEQTSAMKDLVSQYEAILDSEKTEAEKTEELNEWKQTLADTYGFEKDKLRELNLEREEGIELLKQEIKASSQYQRDKWERDNKDQIDTAVDEIYYPEEYQQSLKEYYSRFYNDVSDSVKQVMTKNNTPVTNAFEDLEQQKELYSELVKLKEQADLSELDNIVFTEADQQLLDEVSDEIDILESDIEKYGDIYEQHFNNKAISFFDYYTENNSADDFEEFTEEGKQAYVSWRNGLLEEAGKTEYGSEVQNGLKDILQSDYSEYEKYYENLATAKEKFLSNIKINSQADIEAKKSYEEFIDGLSSDELDILLGLDDTVFNQGIDGVKKIIADIKTDPNYVIEVQIAIDEEKLENLRNSIKDITDSQKDLNSALEEQKEHGQLSASTIQSLTEAGYAEALVIDKVTGAVTLNTTAYEKLINEKKKEIQLEIARLKVDLINPYKDETAAIADLERSLSTLNATEREAVQIKIANMKAQLANSQLTDEQIRQKEQQLAELEAMLASLDAPDFGNSSNKESTDDPWKDEAESKIKEIQHLEAMGQISHEEYINRLDAINQKYFANNTKYLDDYNKYEEEIHKGRIDREKKLFDTKMDNLEKLADKSLENPSSEKDFDNAKGYINTAISDTERRIADIKSGKISGDEDDIKSLNDDLDTLKDKLKDIDKQKIEFEIDIITKKNDNLEREYAKTGNESLIDDMEKNLLDEKSTIQNEIQRLLDDEGYSENSDIVQEWIDKENSVNDELKDIYDRRVNIIKDSIDEQLDIVDREIEQTGDTKLYQVRINILTEGINDIEKQINSYLEKGGYTEDSDTIKELRKKQTDLRDDIIDTNKDAVQAQVDAYNDAIQNEIDILNEYKDTQDDIFDEKIKALEEQKKVLEEQTDELEAQKDIEEKKKALIDAQRNIYKSLRLVYDGNGNWVTKPSQEALDEVDKAKNDLDETLRKQEIDAIEKQITAIEDQQEAFDNGIDKQVEALNNSADEFERIMAESLETRKTLDAELIKAIMGEEKALEFLNSYDEVQKTKESANTSSANEQTNAQTDTQTNNNDSVKSTGQEILDLLHEAKPTMENLNTLMGKVKETFPSYKNMGSVQSYQPDLQPTTREYDSVVNNINNSPTLNNYFTITGANAEEIAKTVSDTFDTKIIKSFQAFYDGYYQASNKTMYGNK